jgi:hypothetical protein
VNRQTRGLPLKFGHYFGSHISSPSGRTTRFPDRQHPGGTAGRFETPTASFIPAQGNALGSSAKDRSER